MMFRNKNNTLRTSVDLYPENVNALKSFADDTGSTYGRVINDLISIFVRCPEEVRAELSSFCREQSAQLDNPNAQGFEASADADRVICAYDVMSGFFSQGLKGIPRGFQKIYLREGYLLCPDDWIILKKVFGKGAEECQYAGVVEARNFEKYGVPHFVFFSDIPYETSFSDKDEDLVYAACAKAWPKFKEILNMQVPPAKGDMTDPDYIEQAEKHLASPYLGMFHITGSDDPIQEIRRRPDPYGCFVFRKN